MKKCILKKKLTTVKNKLGHEKEIGEVDFK